MKQFRHKMFLFSTIFVLVLSSLSTMTAFADEGTPPPPTEETAVQPPVEDEGTPALPTEEPAVQPPAEEPATEIAALPEGTTLVVLDANQEPLPLATEGAASAILNGDPMWCPENATPGDDGCTAAYNSLSDLIASLSANQGMYSGAGTIYISWDYAANNPDVRQTDEGVDIVFDSGSFALTDLVVQGGWDFDNNVLTVAPSDLTGINGLHFNWYSGNLTLNDLLLGGAGWNASTPSGYGLYVYNDGGDVDVNNVDVTDGGVNSTSGARIDTANGGNVYINTRYSDDFSNFSNNTGDGLVVSSNGSIEMYNVTSNGNTNGASVKANNDVYISDSTFNNVKTGLNATSTNGNITLNNVTASGNSINGGAGLTAKNGVADVYCSAFSSNAIGVRGVTPNLYLHGVTFSGNTTDYQNIYAGGSVTVDASYDCGGGSESETPTGTPTTGTPTSGSTPKEPKEDQALYMVVTQTQDQLPSALGDLGTFGSALKVEFFEKAADGTLVTLSFPIPNGMDEANLAVLFWNGSAWVELSGGSVVDGNFVINVGTPGLYVLVSK